MNKRQTEVEKKKLTEEAKILKNLKKQYMKAAEDVAKNIKLQTGKIDSLLMDFDNLSDEDKSILRSVTYRREFQKQLQEQIDGVLDVLNSNQHKDIDEYLKSCYELGFVGSMFDMHGQDVPLILPMDNKAAAKAVKLDPKLSTKLYGAYTRHLKTHIRNEISRGIVTGDTYTHIARNIANRSNQGFNRAMTIVRTEGHRIHMESAYDAMTQAKEKGADVVKQWNSQLDGKTRKTHRKLDGQIRELDEPFEVDGKKVMFPSKFGRPEEDINCRCTVNQRARWMLGDDELETLKKRAEFFELDKAKDFDDFKRKYLKTAKEVLKKDTNPIVKLGISGIIMPSKQVGRKIGKHAQDYGLDASNPTDRQKVIDIIDDILKTHDEVRIGEWRGQPNPVQFYIKGEDIVVLKEDNEFITLLKGGITNERVKNARKR